MRDLRRLLLPLLVLIGAPRAASAFELETTSAGAGLHLSADTIGFTLDLDDSPPGVDPAQAAAAFEASLATWRAALAGADIALAIDPADATSPEPAYTLRWALDRDDPQIEPGVLALTFLSARTSDGEIVGAHIVLNAAQFDWTTSAGCTSEYDLEAALTHELGHVAGLGHSDDHPDATMFATGQPCELGKRDLSDDDLEGVAAIYPDAPTGCSAGGMPGAPMVLVVLAWIAVGRTSRNRGVGRTRQH